MVKDEGGGTVSETRGCHEREPHTIRLKGEGADVCTKSHFESPI